MMEGKIKYMPEYDSYFRMPQEMLPPESAYRFKPENEQIYLGKDRLIFDGGQAYTKEEMAQLQLFFKFMRENKLQCKEITIPIALRHLYAFKFDFKKAFESLNAYYLWHATELPKTLTPDIITALECDFVRIFGRDKYYRPILIVKPERALNNVFEILKRCTEDACIFIMEHILHYMFIPGKVENWVVIIDLSGVGIMNVPREALQKAITCFQNNYRARLGKMFVLNASFMVQALWMIAEGFMDPITRVKLRMTSNSSHPELLELVHPEQLAKVYGGLAELPEKCWPPVFPKGKLRDDFTANHITEEELKKNLIENSRIVPPPSLAQFARDNCKATSKKGPLPNKTFYLMGRIEKRNTFNGIIEVETEKMVEVTKPAVPTTELPAKPATEENISNALPKQEKAPEPARASTNDVKLEIAATENPAPVVEQKKDAADAVVESPPKVEEAPKAEVANLPKAEEAPKAEVVEQSAPIAKASPTTEANNGEMTAGTSTTSAANPKLQPRFNKSKTNEGKASCQCNIL